MAEVVKSEGSRRPNSWRQSVAICLLLAVITLLVYKPVRHFDFTNYDDDDYVHENAVVQNGLSLFGIRWAFTSGFASNWHPLTWISHMLDCELFGLNPGSHHFVNVLFHILNTSLLFLTLKRMTGAVGRSAFAAALFALHPLHVESVAWIAERKDVLSAFFWMLTLWAYSYYVRTLKTSHYMLVTLFFVLGLMAKPMLVTLPFVLLLLDYWPLKRLRFPSDPSATTQSLRHLIQEKIPLIVLSIVSSVITFLVQKQGGAIESIEKFSIASRFGNALVSYGAYIGKMFFPDNLCVLYPHPGTWPYWVIGGAGIFIFFSSLLVLALGSKRSYLISGWLWYLGTLVPVIGIVQVGAQSMADRYTYIPLIGLFILVVWSIADLFENLPHRKIILPLIGAFALLICILVTRSQIQYWQDSVTLFSRAVNVTKENAIAQYNLGQSLSLKNQFAESLEHYQEAIRIKPDYAEAHANLASTLNLFGRYSEATNHYATALRLNPSLSTANYNYGVSLSTAGQHEEAVPLFEAALRLKPDFIEAHYHLGVALAALNKPDESMRNYREAIRLNPSHANALNNLARLLATARDESIRNGAQAIEFAQRACDLTENQNPTMLGTLAAAYAENRQFEKAISIAEQAKVVALATGQAQIAENNSRWIELYRSHRPVRE